MKTYTNKTNPEIPEGVIVYVLGRYAGWFGLRDNEWYGDYVEMENTSDELEAGVVKILTDQIRDTYKTTQ